MLYKLCNLSSYISYVTKVHKRQICADNGNLPGQKSHCKYVPTPFPKSFTEIRDLEYSLKVITKPAEFLVYLERSIRERSDTGWLNSVRDY